MEGLTEGRIVHYVFPENVHRAAIVVNVRDKERGICDLFVFSMPDERGFFMRVECWHDDRKIPESWHWIEKA